MSLCQHNTNNGCLLYWMSKNSFSVFQRLISSCFAAFKSVVEVKQVSTWQKQMALQSTQIMLLHVFQQIIIRYLFYELAS